MPYESGQIFNFWVLLEPVSTGRWRALCVCGRLKIVYVNTLANSTSKSCGCWRDYKTTVRNTSHGYAKRGEVSKTYKAWQQMHYRCGRDPNYLGVEVCLPWKKFNNFLVDMGQRPDHTSLDRKDNAKGYSKDNCRWATDKQQQNNKTTNLRIPFKGRVQTLAEWCAELRLYYKTIHNRIYSCGYSVERAFTEPVKSRRRYVT
jgi:hypothetical protein